MAEAGSSNCIEPSSSSASEANHHDKSGDENEKATLYINKSWRMNLLYNHHGRYCHHLLFNLPTAFEEYDTQRITFLHFSVTTLDLLNLLPKLKEEEVDRIISWIYYLQIRSDPPERCGFQGSSTFLYTAGKSGEDVVETDNPVQLPPHLYSGHITMTYAALVTLLTLGDDLSRIDRRRVLRGVSALQNKDGSFMASMGCAEKDMRFVYCAVCTCYILNDFSPINVPLLVEYIRNSFTYEGSFGSGFGAEGHAAYTYCAVASLVLLEELDNCLSQRQIQLLTRWCLFRQEFGFMGRPNKSEDTCYSYWVGATLKLLDSLQYSNRERNVDFILSNQNPLTGGIGKSDNTYPDPLHTFMGIAGLSLVNYEGLSQISPALTMSEKAVSHLKSIQASWCS